MSINGSEWIWSPASYNLHELPLHDRLGGYHLVLFFCYQKKKKNPSNNTLTGCLWVYNAFLFQPPKNRFYFPLSLRLLLAPDKVKQLALRYQGKVHLLKVSGFWDSKSQRLFLLLQDGMEIWQREKQRGRAAAIPVQASPRLLLAHSYNSASYLWASVFEAAHPIKRRVFADVTLTQTPEQCMCRLLTSTIIWYWWWILSNLFCLTQLNHV